MAKEPPSSGVCETAGAEAERRAGVPAGLLLAIGHIESGRADAASGETRSWPWSINAEGQSAYLESPAAATEFVRSLQARGVRSIDVGCFQINLLHHPTAFNSLDDGFDPAENARYAARFLVSLRAQSGSWEDAVAHYHSGDPVLGYPYRDRVLARWTAMAGGRADTTAFDAAAANVRPAHFATATGTFISSDPSAANVNIWTPSATGTIQVANLRGQVSPMPTIISSKLEGFIFK